MTHGPDRVLSWLAGLLVRGPDSRFVLGDLDETWMRDRTSGKSVWVARRHYLRNTLVSSIRLMWFTARSSEWKVASFGLTWLDVKLGLRVLWKHPVLSAVSVLSLTIGIPLGLAPGYLMDAYEAPLPVAEGERILGLRHWNSRTSGPVPSTAYDLARWRKALTSFEAIAAVREIEQNFDPGTGIGQPVRAAEVTASTFDILQVRPLLGRTLTGADEVAGAPRMAVLGHDLWQARLGGDPGALGRTVRIGGVPHTVVGVMPAEFLFPRREQMWLPLRNEQGTKPGDGLPLLLFGRLTKEATAERAQAEIATVGQQMVLDHPDFYQHLRAEVVSFAAAASGWPRGGLRSRPQARLLLVPAGILLLVACLNVGLLVLARTATRSEEFAVRTALGASRTRIVTQVFTESLVMAVLAAALGLFLLNQVAAHMADPAWSSAWTRLPYWVNPTMSLATVGWALVLAALSAGAASVFPALRVTGKGVAINIQRAKSTGGGFGGRATTALVVVDLAIAVGVGGAVAGVADKIGGMLKRESQIGVPAEQYLVAQLRVPEFGSFASEGTVNNDDARSKRRADIERALVERLRSEAGVRDLAVGTLPGTNHSRRFVEVDGHIDAIDRAWVRPGFFEGFDRPVTAGRTFHPSDVEGDRTAVIVNVAFREEVLGGRNPLGLTLRYPSDGESSASYEVVGIAPDLGADPLNPSGGAAVYHVIGPGESETLQLAIRLGSEPTSFAPRLRNLVSEIDPTVMLDEPTPLSQVVLEAGGIILAGAVALAILAVVLSALAASGIYAIMSHAVTQRTREIGIRTALGARPGRIVSAIGRRAAIQLAMGSILGMPLAGWLYLVIREDPGTPRSDVVTAATVPGIIVVLVVGFLACSAPLARALRVRPAEAISGDD